MLGNKYTVKENQNPTYVSKVNPILHGLFQVCSTRRGEGGGRWHKVPAVFFSEWVKANAIKLGTLTN